MRKTLLSLIVVTSTLFLSGCLLTSAVSTAITVANDRRTAGEVVDDKGIQFNLSGWSSEDKMLKDAHLNFMTYDKEVVITGEVPTVVMLNYVIKQAPLQDFKIKRVINEIRIAKPSSLLSRTKDSAITIKTKFAFQNQEVFNPLHIEIMTENRTVYLMGALTTREADKATKIASTTGGVERVVKLFNYLKTIPAAEALRAKEKRLKAKKKEKLAAERAVIKAKKTKLHRQIRALDPNGGTPF